MFPWLPLVAGVATGVVAMRLIKSDASRAGLAKAGQRLRAATAAGLGAIEGATHQARERLAEPAAVPSEPPAAAPRKAAAKRARRPGARAKRGGEA